MPNELYAANIDNVRWPNSSRPKPSPCLNLLFVVVKDSASRMRAGVDEIDTSGCHMSKACFRVPQGCTSSCDYILTWTTVDQAVSFEMSAAAPSNNYWVSFGLSHDQKMVKI